jgi:hypothetical protein
MYDQDNDGFEFPRMTEAEAEKLHERHERLLARVRFRYGRERTERLREIFREEFERMQVEEGPQGEFTWELQPVDEDVGGEGDELLDGEPELEDVTELEHRLVKDTRLLAEMFLKEFTAKNLIPRGASPEHPLVQLGASTFKASLKLATALDPRSFPPPIAMTALGIVHLKRAQGHLEDAGAALEDAREQRLLEDSWCHEIRGKLSAHIAEVGGLVDELRKKLSSPGA